MKNQLSALPTRAAAMAERLATTARRAGIDDAGAARIVAAFETAMRPRVEKLDDEHHIDYLHPGRTTLILLDDLQLREPGLIAAGALLESLHPELRVGSEDAEAVALVARVPTPDRAGELLLEDLLAAETEVRLIALAEWVDQIRRLHLRDPALWAPLYELTSEVYLPIARWTDPTMARRFQWWCRVFRERFLEGRGGAGDERGDETRDEVGGEA